MPRIPQYGDTKVQSQSYQAPELRIESTDLQPAVQALDTVAQVTNRIQTEEDRQLVLQQEAALGEWQTSYLFRGEDPALSRQGSAVYGLSESGSNDFEEQVAAMTDGMTPRQQRLFSEAAMRRKNSFMTSLSRHEAAQREQAKLETTELNTSQKVAEAAFYWNNTDEIDDRMQSVAEVIQGNHPNLGAEMLSGMISDKQSQLVAGVITQAIGEDIDTAEALLERYSSSLNSAQISALNEDISLVRQSREAMSLAADAEQFQSEAEIRDYINSSSSDPEVRSKAITQAVNHFNARNRDRTRARDGLYSDLYNGVMDGKPVSSYDQRMVDALTPAQQQNLRAAEARLAATGSPYGKFSEPSAINELTQAATNNDEVNMMDYVGRLTESDWKSWNEGLNEAKTGSPARVDELVGNSTAANRLVGNLFGKEYNKLNKENKAIADNILHEVQRSLQEETTAKGRALTPTERDEVMRRFTTQVVVEGTIWDSDYDLSDVPLDDQQQIIDALRGQGRPVNAANILAVYLANN